MKMIEIDIDETQNVRELALHFQKQNLQLGDNLIIKTDKMNQLFIVAVFVVVVSALVIHYKKGQDYANSLLQNLFRDKDLNDIEKEIEDEFGVSIDLETKEQDWYDFSNSNLAKAYAENEPEYDLSMLKEPNPLYSK